MHPLDRPLLLGLVALEQEWVSAVELIDAFRAWRSNPDGSLGAILQSQGKLSKERIDALEEMMASSPLANELGHTLSDTSLPTTTWRPRSTAVASGMEVTTSLHGSAKATDTAPPEVAQYAARLRFRPLRLHAAGGLGQVFEAEDLELHRRVALKEIQAHHSDDPSSRRRFVAEAEITGNLEHPGIVPVYGLGVYPDGRPFYAMRFIEGETLSSAIKTFHLHARGDFHSLPFRQLLTRLVSVCNAVGYAHSRHIVHRDLKPQNVMLGKFGETLVVDWGLAKPLRGNGDDADEPLDNERFPRVGDDGQTTYVGEIVGTPAYMSPEQAQGRVKDIGPPSDVYGLGAILFAMLTGQAPVRGSKVEMVRDAAEGRLVHPGQDQPHVPRALAAICLKAMAREPPDRYASALDLAADIERWLADEPAQAYTEPWTDKAFRWMRKHKLPVAVASALLLVTSVALAIGYVLVRKERDIAQHERQAAVAANALAQENAAATRQVVEQFLIRVGDDRWSQIPGFEDVRLEMVKLAIDRYRELLRQQPDDPALSADAAKAFHRCANLFRLMGRFEPAKGLYDEAVSRLRPSDFADPKVSASYEWQLCEALHDRALLVLKLNGPAAAEQSLRESLSAGRKFQTKNPNSSAAWVVAARAQLDLAGVLHELGRDNEALELARAGNTNLRQSAPKSKERSVKALALLFQVNFGQMLREMGSLGEAKAVLDASIERAQQETNTPEDTNIRFVLARGRFERALVDAAEGAAPGAVRGAIDNATQELEKLVQKFPKTASFRRTLAEALTAQAVLELRRQEPDAAANSADRASRLLEQLDSEEGSPAVFQPLLAAAYIAAGEAELARGNSAIARTKLVEAQQRLRRAREFNPSSPQLKKQASQIESLLASLGC